MNCKGEATSQPQAQKGLSLAKALSVGRGAVVSFVGAGGKTTSMFRLAAELKSAGLRVVTTTTTHIAVDQSALAPACIHVDDLANLGKHLAESGHCLVIGTPDGKGRLYGVPSELIAELHERSDVDAVIVEADGSRSRPLKAPAQHEPVVPEVTTILVPVMGMHSIGRPLDEDHVHRHEIFAALGQIEAGSPVTVEAVARVLAHPDGGAKRRPPHARFVPLLNRAENETAMKCAGELAGRLLASPAVDAVAIGCVNQDPPVREAWMPVAGIILAAGQATRFGSPKQILPWKGATLIEHAVKSALGAGLDPVIVVLGFEAEKVKKAVGNLPVQLVINKDYEAGLSTSLRKGIEALPARAGAAVFMPADQPCVTAETAADLVKAHRRTLAPICVPVFEKKYGNPVLFEKSLFPELRILSGDTGGRVLFDKYRDMLVAVPASEAVLLDIDTSEDYEQACRLSSLS